MDPITIAMIAGSVLGNVVLAFVGLFQRAKKRSTMEQLDTVSEGLKIIEGAVNANKGVLEKTDIGRKISNTIKGYGTAAECLVDRARRVSSEWQLKRPGGGMWPFEGMWPHS